MCTVHRSPVPAEVTGTLLLGSCHAGPEAAAGACVRMPAEAEGMRLTVLPLTRTSSTLSAPRLPRLPLAWSLEVLSKAALGCVAADLVPKHMKKNMVH